MTASHAAPPRVLDCPLEVGPEDWGQREFYLLMTGLVIPRPIGWMSTVSASGVRNLAPYSYFNLMGSDPFYVAFGSTGVKDTLTNVRETRPYLNDRRVMRCGQDGMDVRRTAQALCR